MVFQCSLSDSKSPRNSRTLLSILADFNNAVSWMVSIRLLISNSYSPFPKPLVAVATAPVAIGITVTLMFHNTLCSLARSKYLSLFPFSLIFTQWFTERAKFTKRQVLFLVFFFFLFCELSLILAFRSGLSDLLVYQNPREFYYFPPFGVFHTSNSWWSFTGV